MKDSVVKCEEEEGGGVTGSVWKGNMIGGREVKREGRVIG